MRFPSAIVLCALLAVSSVAPAAETAPEAFQQWIAAAVEKDPATTTENSAAEASPAKAPPLPLHSIEGYGGAPITPMAYLVNPGPKGTVVGLPSASFTFAQLGSKDLEAVSVTQTFFRRVEFSYALNRFGLETLVDDIERVTGVDINRDEVLLHHFNLRVLLIEENQCDCPLPAVTAGVHFKYNPTMQVIDRRLGGAIHDLGFDKSNGVDWTLTATKMFPQLACGRPIIVTGGLRLSKAAQIGLLGFGEDCAATFEGSVAWLATDWLVFAYEFRQKENPYNKLDKLIGEENNWHLLSATIILGDRLTFTTGWLYAGNLANAHADGGWAFQLKWEF